MGQYRFSMEKILDWRLDQEEEAKSRLAGVQEKWLQQNSVIEDLIRESIRVKHAGLKAAQVHDLKNQALYKEMISEKIIQQKNRLAQIENEVQEAQTALTEVHKNKKAMEKLKEKEYFITVEQEKKAEQNELDEIATLSYGRAPY